MQKSDLKKIKLPDAPGVYIFRNKKHPNARGARAGKILYVGKATSLRSRVKSYFNTGIDKSRGVIIVQMLKETASVEWQETDSVLEALILEANLIKKHQPLHNSRDKDNKSFNYLVITREDFPRILVVRGRELFSNWKDAEMKYLFGPFPNGGALKEGLTVVRKIFPFRDKCLPAPRLSPAFANGQVGRQALHVLGEP